MSIFGSHSDAQSPEVTALQTQAREDYQRHNDPETRGAAREQSGQARTNGNAAGGSHRRR